MKRLIPTVALALVVGATQTGCPFTVAGSLIGLMVGAFCDEPFPDRNDRVRKHVQRGAEIGFEVDLLLLAAMFEGSSANRGSDADGTALALLDLGNAEAKEASKPQVIIGPTSCTLAYRF
jgi:hypothetical protein